MPTDETQHFDMSKRPHRCRWFLKPIAWLISLPGVKAHKAQITKIGMDGIKPPYLLLGNHNAFQDMKVSVAATFPHFANYVVAIDGFIGREGLLRGIGCICKRKFTNDISTVRNIAAAIKKDDIVAIYPEARYSLCGTTAPLPESIGKLCKMLGVPVVTLMCHGHHINHPFWNTRHERGVKPTTAEMKLIYDAETLKATPAEEVSARLVEEFQYDDFKWQLENKMEVACPDRAEGLHNVLYQCPHCGKEYSMSSSGSRLKCGACGKEWEMDTLGRLTAVSGETEFSHIPDWYEWERANVAKEVADGTYSSGVLPVKVESLPNASAFIKIGKGTMVHDMDGFKVVMEDGRTMEKSVPSLYSCHIEYQYLFSHGDCVDLNTNDDTWYIYPQSKDFSVTKMALATEELYYAYRRSIGKPCRPGLA